MKIEECLPYSTFAKLNISGIPRGDFFKFGRIKVPVGVQPRQEASCSSGGPPQLQVTVTDYQSSVKITCK